MIGGALAASEGALVERAAAAQSRMQELVDGKTLHQTALTAAEEGVAKAKEVVSAAESSTRETAVAEAAAAKALEEAQMAAAACDTEVFVITADEDELRAAMAADGRYSSWRADGA